ncbi:helix-turn-helix domain-containing protein [Nocardioides szechwanensis]|uniref:helix-turn-helix domain-containing protein n=1 Tax=Nocardioides szechwanensis TaxID=1005944 RepID=UPI000B841DC3
MSKARLVITAVETEGLTQAQAARTYNVSPGWVSKLLARYRAEGEAALEPRSRRPKTSPGGHPGHHGRVGPGPTHTTRGGRARCGCRHHQQLAP